MPRSLLAETVQRADGAALVLGDARAFLERMAAVPGLAPRRRVSPSLLLGTLALLFFFAT